MVWCPEAESNHRHEDFQSSALPTELSGLWKARIKPFDARTVKEEVDFNYWGRHNPRLYRSSHQKEISRAAH